MEQIKTSCNFLLNGLVRKFVKPCNLSNWIVIAYYSQSKKERNYLYDYDRWICQISKREKFQQLKFLCQKVANNIENLIMIRDVIICLNSEGTSMVGLLSSYGYESPINMIILSFVLSSCLDYELVRFSNGEAVRVKLLAYVSTILRFNRS